MRRLRSALTSVLMLVAVLAAVRRHRRLRPVVADVAPELRARQVGFSNVPLNRWTLPAAQRAGALRTPAGRGVTVTKHLVPVPDGHAARVLVVRPDQDRSDGGRPGLLWIHGGGLVLGSPQLELALTGPLARELGAVVVSPDYRLAPRHRFPAALDDCMAALAWLHEHADDLGVDPASVGVGGGSAGGGLAAAVAQRAHDEGLALCSQTLVYPMLDDRTVLRDTGHRGRIMFTPASNRFGWTSYLGREPRWDEAPDYAAPARREDLSGLPPAWVGVGELDLFHDESVDYALRLREAGVTCELVTVPGMYHAAEALVPKAPSMQRFRASMLDHLRATLRVG